MENLGLTSSRFIGNLRSKLDVRQYALEVALSLPDEDKLKKAAEIEEYLLKEVELPGYFDPNAQTNSIMESVLNMTKQQNMDPGKTYVLKGKDDDNPM